MSTDRITAAMHLALAVLDAARDVAANAPAGDADAAALGQQINDARRALRDALAAPVSAPGAPQEAAAAQADPWHTAVLAECMLTESCYQEADSAATVKALIDWHVAVSGAAVQAVGAWSNVRDHGLPPCDGVTVYVGENSAGYIGCFNELAEGGHCLMQTPEGCDVVMSDLVHWRAQDRPAALTPSGAGEGS